MIAIPKGTKDMLPQDAYKWHWVENKAREVAALFGFREMRTPTFEHTELFTRGVGETTDIVNKEMYTFLDKGNRSMTLRPEGTAGVARAFIENGLAQQGLPMKRTIWRRCSATNVPRTADCANITSSESSCTEASFPPRMRRSSRLRTPFLRPRGLTR